MNLGKPLMIVTSTCALLVGCASVAPKELVSARASYEHAAHSPAEKYTPAELHVAHESLESAERAFQADGDTSLVRDQAYIAQRKAERAEVLARVVMLKQGIAVADREEEMLGRREAARTKSELASTKGKLARQQASSAASARELAAERLRTEDAERRAAKANADLARIASVTHEERGTVITLSGSVLFASNKYALLPPAMARVGQVADALLAGDPAVSFVVEGHTDSQGNPSSNQVLSMRRAEAVRKELIIQGISPDRVVAEGHGAERPIANNGTAEGRANNRRVEIVVRHGSR